MAVRTRWFLGSCKHDLGAAGTNERHSTLSQTSPQMSPQIPAEYAITCCAGHHDLRVGRALDVRRQPGIAAGAHGRPSPGGTLM